MVKTKTTPRGGKSHCPAGIATATFTSGTKSDPEQQFQDAPGEETEDNQDWLDYGEEGATQEEGKASTSKSEGKTGDLPKQARGGADAPPKKTLPAPEPTNPQQGTSKDPTEAPAEVPTQHPTQTTTQNPDEDTRADLTEYIKAYKEAGKLWLDTVVDKKEQAYTTLFDTLQQLGDPHIDNLTDANREQVFKCIRDRTGRFLSEDKFTLYVEQEEEKKKPKYKQALLEKL